MTTDGSLSRRELLSLTAGAGVVTMAGCLGMGGGGGGSSSGPKGTIGKWSLDINAPKPAEDRITGADWTPPKYDDGEVASDIERMNLGSMKNDPATKWWHGTFKEKTGITTNAVTVPSKDAVSKMRTLLSSGSENPALMQISQEFFMDFVAEGWLEPVDELWNDATYELFPPYYKEQLTTGLDRSLDGDHTYISVALAEGHWFNYNPSILKELGVKPDIFENATWADVRSVCEKAKAHSKDYFGFAWWGKGNRYPIYPWLQMTWSRGGSFVQDGSVVVNSKEAVAALDWQRKLLDQQLAPNPTQYGEGGLADLFLSERLAGYVGKPGMMSLAYDEWGEDTDKYMMALPPKAENGTQVSYMNTDFLAINRGAPPKKKRAGMLYMDGSRSAIASAHEYDQEGNYPSNSAAWDTELLSDAHHRKKAQKNAKLAKVEMWPKQMQTYDVLVTKLQQVWLGEKSAQAGLDEAQSEIDNILKDN